MSFSRLDDRYPYWDLRHWVFAHSVFGARNGICFPVEQRWIWRQAYLTYVWHKRSQAVFMNGMNWSSDIERTVQLFKRGTPVHIVGSCYRYVTSLRYFFDEDCLFDRMVRFIKTSWLLECSSHDFFKLFFAAVAHIYGYDAVVSGKEIRVNFRYIHGIDDEGMESDVIVNSEYQGQAFASDVCFQLVENNVWFVIIRSMLTLRDRSSAGTPEVNHI